jgi:hypothetical protein
MPTFYLLALHMEWTRGNLFAGSATVNKSITEHDAPNVNDLYYQIFGTLTS